MYAFPKRGQIVLAADPGQRRFLAKYHDLRRDGNSPKLLLFNRVDCQPPSLPSKPKPRQEIVKDKLREQRLQTT